MILTANDIHKSYTIDGKLLPVLRGVSLEVKEKEILVIQGPSGAGKSTLLHILGLLDKPTKGEIKIEGRLFRKRQNRQEAKIRNSYIGIVFQFYNLLPDFNVFENVCLPALITNGSFAISKDLKKKACEILDLVGLSHRLKHRPSELSGGEQQRASIARAVINGPRLLLADEPTGNLDSQNAERIWALLIQLKEEQGQTIVVVTHNEEFTRRGDRSLHLIDGMISPQRS